MLIRFANRNRFAQAVSRTKKGADLQLVIKLFGWAEYAGAKLAIGTPHRYSAHHDGRGAAVISNWNMLVVGQKRIVGAKHFSDICRVMNRGVKIGVIANHRRQQQLAIRLSNEFPPGRALRERLAQPVS